MKGVRLQLRWPQPLVLALYRSAFTLLLSLYVLIFPLWIFTGKRRNTLLKRLGWQDYPPAQGGAVWIHALSIGELSSARTLIEQVRAAIGTHPLYLSVSTLSAHDMATNRFSGLCDSLFYFPYDTPFSVKHCLNRVDPALVVLVETDIWPGFLSEIRRRHIACVLVNGRLSPESFRTYRACRVLFQPAFNSFEMIYPQSPGERDRFLAIGVEPARIRRTGNLKFDVALSLPSAEALEELREAVHLPHGSRVLIAGSTHPGEEALVRSCYLRLREVFPDLRLIVVPRRPERGPEVCELFRNDGIDTMLFSQPTHAMPTVVVIDRMGLLSRLYALADIAVIGGSFVPKGGQNPIEPAACGNAVLFGPDMHDFPDVSKWLVEAGGAMQANNADDLYAVCHRLLSDPQLARTMGDQARRVVTEHQGTTVHIVKDIVHLLT